FLPTLMSSLSSSLFFFQPHRPLRDLHSFPTRRSSDLFSTLLPNLRELKISFMPFFDFYSDSVIRDSFVHNLNLFVNSRKCVIAQDRKSTRLNSSHVSISYAVFCLKKKSHKPTATDTTS